MSFSKPTLGQRLPSAGEKRLPMGRQALAGDFGPPAAPHILSDMAKAMALANPSADLGF